MCMCERDSMGVFVSCSVFKKWGGWNKRGEEDNKMDEKLEADKKVRLEEQTSDGLKAANTWNKA